MTHRRIYIDLKKSDYQKLAALVSSEQSVSRIIRIAVKEFLEKNK